MRRLLPLIILVVLLIAVYSLSRVSADWRYIVPDAPGTLLYATGFDSAGDEWETAAGRLSMQVQAGTLRIDVGVPDSEPYAPLRWYLRNFDLTVTATAAEGPENNGYGVIFRIVNRQNYYVFLISSDGYYQLRRVLDGQSQLLTDWTPSPLIETGIGASNDIGVTAQDDTFRFFINGESAPLCLPENLVGESTYDVDGTCMGQVRDALTDKSIPDGKVGVVAKTLDDEGVVVDFDNVVIYSP